MGRRRAGRGVAPGPRRPAPLRQRRPRRQRCARRGARRRDGGDGVGRGAGRPARRRLGRCAGHAGRDRDRAGGPGRAPPTRELRRRRRLRGGLDPLERPLARRLGARREDARGHWRRRHAGASRGRRGRRAMRGARREGLRRGRGLGVGRDRHPGDPVSRTARWLTVAIALAGPAAGVAQTAQVGSKPGPSGAVVGRVCLDLDRDGSCRGDEPGIAGARLRLEDGRRLTADESGAFHVAELSGRIMLPDRSAYGAHVLSVDGLGTVGRFELAPGGVARVDLPVEPPAAPAQPSPGEPHAAGLPRVEGDRLVWTLGGAAGAGAWVRAGGREARASEDGGWSLALPLADGANSVGVAVGADGGAVLWVIDLHVARPASGALRVYPGRPQLLATVTLLPASDGALLVGRAEPGSALRIGGGEVRVAGDGRFAAWHGPVGPGVTSLPVEVELAGAKVEAALPVTPPGSSFDGVVLGELELQLGGDAGFLASGRLAGFMSGRWSGFTVDAGADLDDRDRSALRLASPRDASAHSLLLDPVRVFPESGDRGTVEDANAGRGRLWGRGVPHGEHEVQPAGWSWRGTTQGDSVEMTSMKF